MTESSTKMPPPPSSARPMPPPYHQPLSPLEQISSASSAAVGMLLLVVLLVLLTVQCNQANYPGRKGDFCHTDTFRPNCSEDEVIVMQEARYGRMKIGRCVEIDLGHVGCFADVLLMADRRCSGKRLCSIRIPDAEFESRRPCLKELKTYLDASYQCVPVQTLTSDTCRTSAAFPVRGQSGYIASIVTSDTPSCDGSRQPWSVRVAVGQRINLTLYDFALERDSAASSAVVKVQEDPGSLSPGTSGAAEPGRKCRQYGVLEDTRPRKTFVICGGQKRIRWLYTSEGDVVKLWITAGIGPRDLQRFVIQYSAVGCADLVDLPGTHWFVRSGPDVGMVGCKHSTDVWHLRCIAHLWIGDYFNCSSPSDLPFEAQERNAIDSSYKPSSSPASPPSASHSFWSIQLIAIAGALIIVIVAVVISFSLLVVVKSRRRRKTSESMRGPRQLDTASSDFDGKQPLKLNGGELMRDIQTLSSALPLSTKMDQCHVSCHWDTRYTQMDSFA